MGAPRVMAVPLLGDLCFIRGVEKLHISSPARKLHSGTSSARKASGEGMENFIGSSSTVKGAFAGAGSAAQCMDLLRRFRADNITLHFRSLGKGMHEYLWW